MNEVNRDCNTCRHHTQAQVDKERCHGCVIFPALPLYQPVFSLLPRKPTGREFLLAEAIHDTKPAAPPVGLPTDAAARKGLPIMSGCLDYFPDALLAVAHLSRVANEKHNPGEPMHWSKGKSNDHADCAVRHLMERGKWDTTMNEPVRHSTSAAWRALANLQTEIENEREVGK